MTGAAGGMRPSRPMPEVGMRARVRYLAVAVDAVVEAVDDGGLHVTALTADGELLRFSLRLSTGQYHAADDGPRLILEP